MKTALSREYLRAYYVNGRDITICYAYTELEKKIIKMELTWFPCFLNLLIIIYEAEKTIAKHLFEPGPYDYRANRDDAAVPLLSFCVRGGKFLKVT